MRFAEITETPTEQEILLRGWFKLSRNLYSATDLRWARKEVARLQANGVSCLLVELSHKIKGLPAFAVFRDRECEARFKRHGE